MLAVIWFAWAGIVLFFFPAPLICAYLVRDRRVS